MRALLSIVLLFANCFAAGGAELANSNRGKQVLQEQGCLGCHTFNVRLRSDAPGTLSKRRLSATRLAGAIWGHAPTIWHALERQDVFTALSTAQAYDLVAWFMAAGYFEQHGSVRTGEILFEGEGCIKCHRVTGKPGNGADSAGPPLAQWNTVTDPVPFFKAIWSHAPLMRTAMDRKQMNWPSLSAQEMSDILAYAGAVAGRPKEPELILGDPDKGKAIFRMRECVSCHNGKLFAQTEPRDHTLTELSATLWNHAPMMMNFPPSLSGKEISDLLAFLWQSGYFEMPGNAAHGRALFESKNCALCHQTSKEKTPFAGKGRFDAAKMIAALWSHSPRVMNQARGKGIVWPRFDTVEMADLIAYINQGNASGWQTEPR
ncbi:MAG: cytochrome c [Bryobacterales bacterium]|nr:cytochrome c [Bryobacterales bacterium]